MMSSQAIAIRHLLFDLDETLYTDTTGLFLEVGDRIEGWTARELGVSREKAQQLRREYYQAYGTTMAGLRHEHPQVDVDDFLNYVHDVDVSRYLQPDPALAKMLSELPAPKSIFTNSITDWAERVTQQLGIRDCFEHIFDVRSVDYRCKPNEYAFISVLEHLQLPAQACVMLDDQVSYLMGAAQLGMRTVLVRRDSRPSEGIDYAVPSVLDAGPLLHRLIAGPS
jgi:putative hydrolase of the HAD superfamily